MPNSATKSVNRTFWQRVGTAVLAPVFYAYLRLVSRTGKFNLEHKDILAHAEMLGYWHGDSPGMLLLLLQLCRELPPVDVVVTADWRGDIIARVLQKSGANVLRTKDGMGIRQNLQQLQEVSGRKDRIFVLAMDGPLGPRHKAKKLLPHLAKKARANVYKVQFGYRRVLCLKKRWDKYTIPLPFGSVNARVELGVQNDNMIKNITSSYEYDTINI